MVESHHMSVNLVSSIIRCVLNAREFPRDYLTMSRRSDIMREPINHPELIRLILLAALTENLSTRRNSKVFGENGGGRESLGIRGPASSTCSQVTN